MRLKAFNFVRHKFMEAKNMSEYPKAPTARLLKGVGAERVSTNAVDVLTQAVEDYAISVSEKATTYAKHAGRKTVQADDVRLALKNW